MEIGTKVVIIDESYLIRIDGYVNPGRDSWTNIRSHAFKILRFSEKCVRSQTGAKVHDVIIKDLATDAIYLHSKAFLKVIPDEKPEPNKPKPKKVVTASEVEELFGCRVII